MDLDDLLVAAKEGGPRERARLFHAVRRLLLGHFPKHGVGGDLAEDLAQETVIRVFEKLDHFEPEHPGAFRKWIFEIARRVAANHRRRGDTDKVRCAVLGNDPAMAQTEPSPPSKLYVAQKLSLVDRKKAELKGPLRAALDHRLAGRSTREAAKLEGVGERALRQRSAKAITMLRRKVAREWPSPIDTPADKETPSPT